MTTRILVGDCRDILRTLPDESVHCCVCSPPYWGLRSYGIGIDKGEIGLEPSLSDYIDTMRAVFAEVRRVLRKDGTLWLNIGDSYATSVNGRSAADTKTVGNDDRTFRDKPFSTVSPDWNSRVGQSGNKGNPGADHHFRISDPTLKPKDLCGMPWRVAFALQADGWYLRSDIIWSKPNPMPESVTDRPTKAHEYLFLLSKSERYYYDAEAIKEKNSSAYATPVDSNENQRRSNAKTDISRKDALSINAEGRNPREWNGLGRNRRSVWEIPTSPYSEAHFATFPPALVEPCIKAGCPEKCCAKCGAPWVRQVERDLIATRGKVGEHSGQGRSDPQDAGSSYNWSGGVYGRYETKTLGFSPSCSCHHRYNGLMNAPILAGTVLDPFGGAGTTGLVADRLGRNAILIELNPKYAEMAERRLQDDAGLFYNADPILEAAE